MSICYPDGTDWGCAYSPEDIERMRDDEKTAALMERSEALAWYTLASLTAWTLGVCPELVRPCAKRCSPPGTWIAAPVGASGHTSLPLRTIGGTFTPHIGISGGWVNSCSCSGGDVCSCGPLDEIVLPGPIGDIVEVRVDGEVIDPARYRVDNGDRLVSLDPELSWPICQDMTAAVGQPGSFTVEYYRGMPPHELSRFAAGLLAVEFYKACTTGKCRLPQGVTQVVRGGTTFEIETGLFMNGTTGIREVDAFIRILNPYALKSRPRVLAPSSGTPRRQTWGYR